MNIIDGGASIRIVRGEKTLLVTKAQIKAIDTIGNGMVRIDNGEGPLRNIFLNYQEVNQPEVGNAEELRDIINNMLGLQAAPGGGDCYFPPELIKLWESMASTLGQIRQQAEEPPVAELTLIDESNPYMIYKGWHSQRGNQENPEWAIERIRRVEEIVIHEWAYGTKRKIFRWTERMNLPYAPFDYTNPYGPVNEKIAESPQSEGK